MPPRDDDVMAHAAATPTAERPGGSPPSRRRRAFWFVLVALLLAGIGAGLYGFNAFRDKMIKQYLAGMKPPPVAVSVVPVDVGPAPRSLPAIGSLVAVHQVTVAPQVAGRVTKVGFEAGQVVHRGDVLVQLDDAVEQAALADHRAQARLAQSNLERSRTLEKRDFATRASVDQYQSQLDQANAGIAGAQATIGQKQLRAPFDGRLGKRQVELGQFAQPGTPLVVLTDLSTLWVDFTLPEQNLPDLTVGQVVEVEVDAFPGHAFQARLSTVDPQVDAGMRAIRLQATLANPDGLLLPGMFAAVRVLLPPRPGVISVPATAVDYSAYGQTVYVVREAGAAPDGKPQWQAKQVIVQTGEQHDDRIAVLSGLQQGDRVVAAGQVKLHDGALVQPTGSTGPAAPATPPRN